MEALKPRGEQFCYTAPTLHFPPNEKTISTREETGELLLAGLKGLLALRTLEYYIPLSCPESLSNIKLHTSIHYPNSNHIT
jgi:hypothetical protein